MLWYFKNKQSFDYPSNELINNSLTQRFRNSVYENSNEMELYYALQYMKENNISALSVVFPIEDLSVNYGQEGDINKEFCDSNNIHYRYENRSGGCMVLFPGNIITLDVYPTDNFLRQHAYLNELVDYLKSKNINATTNNNDLMIDGKKIIGAVSETLPKPYKGWVYFAVSISINADSDLIDQICLKPMNKVPGTLSNYGITTEEIFNWTLDWFERNKYIGEDIEWPEEIEEEDEEIEEEEI